MLNYSSYQQDATYWGNPTLDGYGAYSFDAPILLKVRWEERVEKFVGPQGEDFVSRAVVWVKQDLDLGGYMFLGTSVELNPQNVEDTYLIRQIFEIPDMRNMSKERRVFL